MTEPDSPIIDFYPEEFEIDMNGKKMAWQGVALLPFIDQHRLLAAMEPQYVQLTDEEKRRNRWGNNVIMAADGDPLYDFLCGLYTKNRNSSVRMSHKLDRRNSTILINLLYLGRTAKHYRKPRNVRCGDG